MIVICGSECTGLVKKCELLLPIKGRKKKNIKKKKKDNLQKRNIKAPVTDLGCFSHKDSMCGS